MINSQRSHQPVLIPVYLVRVVFLILAVLILTVPSIGYAQSEPATVVVSKLNVRQGPSRSARVVDQLNQGARVVAFGADGAWAQIAYRKNGEAFMGWVAIQYLAFDRLQRGYAGSTQEQCDEDDVEVSLVDARATDLYCDRSLIGDGYGECVLEVDVEVSRSCNPGEDIDVRVECDATLTGYEGRNDRLGNDYHGDENAYFEIDRHDEKASARLEISIDVAPISGATTRVDADRLDCDAERD